MSEKVETVIIGGGQGGLATSYYLTRLGRENIVLEKEAQAANSWRNDRWDSFTLVTPNWYFRLPGAEYHDSMPDDFMPRDEIVGRFERYVEDFHLPVSYQTRVTVVEPSQSGRGYLVKTGEGSLKAENVVVATGLFQQPRMPSAGNGLAASITQIASGQYRNPDALPPGAVLVVGSGQSGCQIAEELYRDGRRVFLCTGSAGRAPRRYRDKDVFVWLEALGFLNRTVGKLESPREKFTANPHVSGARGGHALNLHQFARDGVTLLGHMQGARDGKIQLAPDLRDNLAKGDKFEAELVKLIDQLVDRTGLDAPPEELPSLRDGYEVERIEELDLRAAGVSTVIWATGYRFDFSLVKLPVTDTDGFPVSNRGVTGFPGLYFIGMPWLYTQSSGLLGGVGRDAAYIATKIAGQVE